MDKVFRNYMLFVIFASLFVIVFSLIGMLSSIALPLATGILAIIGSMGFIILCSYFLYEEWSHYDV